MGDYDAGDLLLPPSSSSDELSNFLRQILSRTPTTQPSLPPDTASWPQQPCVTPPPKRVVSTAKMFDRTLPSVHGGSVSSTGVEIGKDKNTFENKTNGGAKQSNSLKRNIDAQFHNLSEKRRRSKINEKMKALQKLIPNSNKTDKASMLDEAIEYLKHLQLQVQTLAVMNGFGLNPMGLPPVLPPTQSSFNEILEQELNMETLSASHSLVHHEQPPESIQAMCFSRATLL